MRNYVIDIHTLLWYLLDDSKLSNDAKEIYSLFESGEIILVIPSIVLLELMFILEKRNESERFKDIFDELKTNNSCEIFSVDTEIISAVSKITSIKEIHDRIIVATAKILDCPLITKDEQIIKSGEVECIF